MVAWLPQRLWLHPASFPPLPPHPPCPALELPPGRGTFHSFPALAAATAKRQRQERQRRDQVSWADWKTRLGARPRGLNVPSPSLLVVLGRAFALSPRRYALALRVDFGPWRSQEAGL